MLVRKSGIVVSHAGIWRNAYTAHCTINLTLHAMGARNPNAVYHGNSHQHPPYKRLGMAHSQYEQREE
jgi:hypothetical protein